MPIHHATVKKAAKLGVILEDLGADEAPNQFKAFWPKYSVVLFGPTASDVLTDMETAITIRNNWASFRVQIIEDDTFVLTIRKTDKVFKGPRLTPLFAQAKAEWEASRAELDVDDEEEDNEEQAEIEAEADEEEQEARATGTVVHPKYRTRYAEAGHPDNCGDWLAETLDNYCKNKEGTDLETFTMILNANGIDMSKYKVEKPSDRGRYRMTGRNMLSRRVFVTGQLLMPETLNGGEPHRAPQEWRDHVAPRYAKLKQEALPAETQASE